MKSHVHLIAWMQILYGVLGLIITLSWTLFWILYASKWGAMDFVGTSMKTPERVAEAAQQLTFPLIALRYLWTNAALSGTIGITAGFGLLGFKRWGRSLAIVACVIDILLLNPLSILMGVYGLVILMNPVAGELF